MVERILYIWAIRHPASGYVQGINDLVTPFLMVFLQDFVDKDVTKSSFVFEVELAMGLIFSLLEMGIKEHWRPAGGGGRPPTLG